jgi:hypothetical protein
MHGRAEMCISNFRWKTLRGKNCIENLGIDCTKEYERLLEKCCQTVWTGFILLRAGISLNCEYGNETLVSIVTDGEFSD